MESALTTLQTGPKDAACSWFALQVKPRHERAIARALRSHGLDEFLPLYRAKRRWSDRVKELDVPLFPQYLFCRFGALDRLRVVSTPGVRSIVGIGKTPAPVADNEIAALQTVVRSGLAAHPWPFLRTGQWVRIDAGPLRGLEGILAGSRSPYRLVIAVTLLQRSVAVEVDRLDVTPLPAPGSARGDLTHSALAGWGRPDRLAANLDGLLRAR